MFRWVGESCFVTRAAMYVLTFPRAMPAPVTIVRVELLAARCGEPFVSCDPPFQAGLSGGRNGATTFDKRIGSTSDNVVHRLDHGD